MSTAVDNLADTLANASIADPTSTSPTGNTNAAQNPEVIASAAEGRRLYIGNLAYATSEGELKDFFQGFSVESTSIPVNPRTNRPVGYAFVDLVSSAEAEKAIAELSGKEILERKVSVQLARNPADKTEGAVSGGEASGGEGRKRGSGRGRGRGRGRGGRFSRGGRANDETHDTTVPPAEPDAQPLADVTNQGATATPAPAAAVTEIDAATKDAKPRVPRPHKQRGPPEDGIPSKTKVMVANLPYDLSEEKLKELFAAYEPTSAKIALRPIPRFMVKKLQARNEPRKGRGFGFVTLGSEELQNKAVTEMNGKEIEGREIAVKVAIDSPGKEDDDVAGIEGKENGVEAEHATEATA